MLAATVNRNTLQAARSGTVCTNTPSTSRSTLTISEGNSKCHMTHSLLFPLRPSRPPPPPPMKMLDSAEFTPGASLFTRRLLNICPWRSAFSRSPRPRLRISRQSPWRPSRSERARHAPCSGRPCERQKENKILWLPLYITQNSHLLHPRNLEDITLAISLLRSHPGQTRKGTAVLQVNFLLIFASYPHT